MTPDSQAAAAIPVRDAGVRLRSPADLLTAVPFLLGFHPRDSLVVVSTERGSQRVGLTVRVELPADAEVAALSRQLVRTMSVRRPSAVLLLVVGGGRSGPARRDVVDAVGRAFEDESVRVQARVWAAELTAGAAWSCYDDCGCAGTLDDPAASAVAAATVAAGHVTYPDRSALARLIAPADEATLARRSSRIDAAIDAALLDGEGASAQAAARDYATVARAVDEAVTGGLALGDNDVVQLAVALSDARVRDACLALTVGEQASGAEQLWTELTRQTPDPEAAEPATLLAVAAMMRGNGGLANVALERAQRAWPGHRLSALLDAAVQAGTAPAQLRVWIDAAAADALGRLGVETADVGPVVSPSGDPA